MKANYNTVDWERGKRAEQIVLSTLAALTDEYTFKDVSDRPDCYCKGDILALGENKMYYVEVKNDRCIGKTQNVLCEEEVYIKANDYYERGNMSCDYDIYCVVSESTREIYIMDFKVIKEIYKRCGDVYVKDHYNQTTFGYLLPLCRIKQFGGLIKVLNY